jgi:hypothetical protein
MSEQQYSPVSSPVSAPPPIAATRADDAPTMSTAETLTNIFFEPGRTFEALRARPRFLVAALIILVLTILVTVLVMQKVDFDQFMREQFDKSERTQQMPAEQREQAVKIARITTYFSPPVVLAIVFAAGAAIYMLAAMVMGGALKYKQALAVWVYSSFPPAVLGTVVALIVLALKSSDDIDLTQPGGGLLQTNPAILLGPDSSPALKSMLGSLDLFAFYGLFLAAIGLRKVARLSSGAAWTIVIGIWLIGVLLKVGWAAMFG